MPGADPSTAAGRDATAAFWDRLEEIRERLRRADGLVLCTDFDGTLAPIVEQPDEAAISPGNRDLLRTLGEHDAVRVGVVSGRALDDVRSRVELPSLAYAGNHGLELARPGSDRDVVHPIAARRRPLLATVCDEIGARLSDVEGCFVENKSITASVHYRRAPSEAVPRVRETVGEVLDEMASGRLHAEHGKAVVEIHQAIPWNKGAAVSLLRGSSARPAVYLGDDTTDETVFERFGREDVGIHVGDGPTAASYRIEEQAAVEEVFAWFADEGLDLLEGGSTEETEEPHLEPQAVAGSKRTLRRDVISNENERT